jgi:16S rRNA processing protein RimM
MRIESVRGNPPDLLVKVEGIDTREAARVLVGSELRATREFAAPLGRDEYYQDDLCRCGLFYGDELIGTVRSVWDTGACQLLEVISAAGRQFLVPFVDHFIGEVDVDRGRISLKEDYIVR